MTDAKGLEVAALMRQLRSDDSDVRCEAACRLGRIYSEEKSHSPSLAELNSLIAEINDVRADVAAPFVRHFTNPVRPRDGHWEAER